MICPNKNSKEWKDLVKRVGESNAYLLFDLQASSEEKVSTKKVNRQDDS